MTAALTFTTPPHGLAPHVDFLLSEVEGADGLYALQSRTDAAIRLFVLDAAVYLPDYAPIISDEDCVALDLHTPQDALLLVVANPGADGTTMNLLAPVVVNASSGVSAQIILDGQDFPLRAELAARRAA
jgi:flagellar assembly factor FliW